MGKIMLILLTLVALTAVSVSLHQTSFAQQHVESHVVPLKEISELAMDKRFETVSGDPAKPGTPFVIRIHAEAGYVIMPHTHEVDENIVVVKGSWALGMGQRFNRANLAPMEVGDYGFAPKKMAHFALSKSYTIIQVHGIGPFGTQWVVPVYELTDKGVLLKISASDLGRPLPVSPEGCFALKLGARVRSSYGEGVVVGAQCTPGDLTQYRVEKPDGERFWGDRDELTTILQGGRMSVPGILRRSYEFLTAEGHRKVVLGMDGAILAFMIAAWRFIRRRKIREHLRCLTFQPHGLREPVHKIARKHGTTDDLNKIAGLLSRTNDKVSQIMSYFDRRRVTFRKQLGDVDFTALENNVELSKPDIREDLAGLSKRTDPTSGAAQKLAKEIEAKMEDFNKGVNYILKHHYPRFWADVANLLKTFKLS